MKELGSLVQRNRERVGYHTQREFAAAWGKDQSLVSRLENGTMKMLPSPEDLGRLAVLIRVPVVELIEAAGYRVREESAGADEPSIAELTEHARLVDWERDPARLPVMHAIMETWSRFDRNSLRLVAEASPQYDDDGNE